MSADKETIEYMIGRIEQCELDEADAPLLVSMMRDLLALQSWQESTAIYLADADRALSVLFTMLTKIGQKEGAIVADETRANVRAAMKEVAHSKSTAQPLGGEQS